jgi:hypothetical protein
MEIRQLTEEEYLALKDKLHHAHDKVWKITLHDREAIQEYLSKVIAPLLVNVKLDLETLKLDNTTYIHSNLQAFYADVVYWADVIDLRSNEQTRVTIAFLLEHKSKMPTQLQIRLQLSAYMISIMTENYDEKTDTTIGVIPIVFNQFDKPWVAKPFRSLFKDMPADITRFLMEFEYLVTNLPAMTDEYIEAFDKYGVLRATFLAMKHVRNKEFLKQHFEDIFLFLEKHPQRIDLRDQLIAYLLGNSDISAQDLEDMLKNIFSPIIHKEVMLTGTGFIATAAREVEIKVRKEEKILAQRAVEKAVEKALAKERLLSSRNVIIQGWLKNMPSDTIYDFVQLSRKDVDSLIDALEKIKKYQQTHKRINLKTLTQLTGLYEEDLNEILKLLSSKP